MNKPLALILLLLIATLTACTTAPAGDSMQTSDADERMDNDEVMTDDTPSTDDATDDTSDDVTAPVPEPTMQTQVIDVDIRDFRFSPSVINARVGDTIRFTNFDSVGHTATSVSGEHSFDSGLLRNGESFEYVVQNAGTTDGHCTPHPNMRFTLVVQ